MSDTKRQVTLAYPYTDAAGKTHQPDATIPLDHAEANRLLFNGLAREADTSEKKG